MQPTRAAQALMLRSGRRLGGWLVLHRLLMRLAALYLRLGTGAGVYVRGSFGRGEPAPGLSDIDLVVVAHGRRELAWQVLQHRRERLQRVLGPLRDLVTVALYSVDELADAWSSHALRYGLNGGGKRQDPRAAALHFRSRAPADELGFRRRPIPPAPGADWRRVAGPDLRPPAPSWDERDRAVVAWLELQYWWQHAFRLACDSAQPAAAYMCVKLVAEPSRTAAWLERRSWPPTRLAALEQLLVERPEEAEAAAAALSVERRLPAPTAAPVAVALASLRRATGRVAATIAMAGEREGLEPVELLGAELMESLLPLADSRALAAPERPDETFRLVAGDPADARALARAAAAPGRAALAGGGLLAFPSASPQQTRSVQCQMTDPVSFALLAGHDEAAFPRLPGWSAGDVAARAVAEHAAWLHGWQVGGRRSERGLGLLLTAARAGLFLESIERRKPALPLTVTSTVEQLGRRGPAEREAAEAAAAELEACQAQRRPPSAEPLAALHDAVVSLPAYSRA